MAHQRASITLLIMDIGYVGHVFTTSLSKPALCVITAIYVHYPSARYLYQSHGLTQGFFFLDVGSIYCLVAST